MDILSSTCCVPSHLQSTVSRAGKGENRKEKIEFSQYVHTHLRKAGATNHATRKKKYSPFPGRLQQAALFFLLPVTYMKVQSWPEESISQKQKTGISCGVDVMTVESHTPVDWQRATPTRHRELSMDSWLATTSIRVKKGQGRLGNRQSS